MNKRGNIPRILDLESDLKKKSLFLLGPRQTGKSFLIRHQLKKYRYYNLLLKDTFQKLSFNPSLIGAEVDAHDRIVVIDEIQKLPELLDEVQNLIEERGIHFLLTGSSARRLRQQGTNLLGGRARVKYFHPFTYHELKERFDLDRALNVGLIPSIYLSDEPEQDLRAYAGLYLQQEIAAEGLTRSLPAFSRFLEVAALCNGEQVDFTAISNDAQVPRTTVHEYFGVLQDTLIASELPAWKKSLKRKPVSTSKFYFFDWGIVRTLQKLGRVERGSPGFGKAFEAYLYHEIRTFCDYRGISDLHYWRSRNQDEVDFIIGDEVAVEVKGKATLSPNDFKPLLRLMEEKMLKKYFVVYAGDSERVALEDPRIQVLPWEAFLNRLWSGEVLG